MAWRASSTSAIAKAADRLQTTTDGSIKGKRAYMAPEQIVGGEVTPRTDVYSMAVVLWEMLTCQRLFVGDSNVARAVLGGATSPPSDYAPDVTPELDAIVMKGLSLDAASRFSSAREMAEALQRAVAPAFATEVGEWVRETARENLGKRTALLAAIEGGAASRRQVQSFCSTKPRRSPFSRRASRWRRGRTTRARCPVRDGCARRWRRRGQRGCSSQAS